MNDRKEKFRAAFNSKKEDIKDFTNHEVFDNSSIQNSMETQIPTEIPKLSREEKFRAAFNKGYENDSLKGNLNKNLMQGSESYQGQEESFNWPRFIGENLAQGVFSIGDLAQFLAQNVPGNKSAQDYINSIRSKHGAETPEQDTKKELLSEKANRYFKEKGVDLQSMGKGDTTAQRLVAAAARGAPSAVIGGPAGIARNLLISSGVGVANQGLKEMGVPESTADVATLVGSIAAPVAINKTKSILRPKSAPISSSERKVLEMAKSDMTPSELNTAIESLESFKPNKLTGYDPLTAEVAGSPTLAQYYRARQPIPESGITQRAGFENDKVLAALENKSSGALKSHELQDSLQSELSKRIQARRDATSPGYEAIKKLKDRVNPVHTKKHIKENYYERGGIESDLNKQKKDIQTRDFGDMTKSEYNASIAKYKKELKEIPDYLKGTPHYAEAKKAIEPKNLHPTVGELESTRQSLRELKNVRMKAGREKSALKLGEAIKALEKDTAKFPIVKETRAKYKELSIPVNEIKQNEKIMKIIKSKANNVMKYVFDADSGNTTESLKKIFGEDGEKWKALQAAGLNRFKNSIKNAGASGSGNVISSNKVDKFISEHDKALKNLFSKEQVDLVDEIVNITKGQNFAKTAGMASGSPTESNRIVNLNIRKKLNLKDDSSSLAKDVKGEILSRIPLYGKLSNYLGKHKEEKLMKVIDKVMLDKDFALKLLKSPEEIKTQSQFNKFMNESLLKTTALYSSKNKEGKE